MPTRTVVLWQVVFNYWLYLSTTVLYCVLVIWHILHFDGLPCFGNLALWRAYVIHGTTVPTIQIYITHRSVCQNSPTNHFTLLFWKLMGWLCRSAWKRYTGIQVYSTSSWFYFWQYNTVTVHVYIIYFYLFIFDLYCYCCSRIYYFCTVTAVHVYFYLFFDMYFYCSRIVDFIYLSLICTVTIHVLGFFQFFWRSLQSYFQFSGFSVSSALYYIILCSILIIF
jgi:hypothetical protein